MAGEVTFPLISEDRITVEEIQLSDTAYAALRKPREKALFRRFSSLHGVSVKAR